MSTEPKGKESGSGLHTQKEADRMTARERYQQIENETLMPWAARSSQTRGRAAGEPECPLRTPFQRDRDRVIHCKSFRRLKHKTQVFLAPQGDHYRTRLTHTLEVSQIARTIARALGLNEDLTEAIALAHDLGHTPFGHAGERALNALAPGNFHHYLQSVRVVERLEKEGRGLNLTWEVRNGVACHTEGKEAATAEGRLVRWADKIAYINHDIDDAIRAGVLTEADIPRDIVARLGSNKTQRITTLIMSVVENSRQGTIAMAPADYEAYEALHAFMYEAVYRTESLMEHFQKPGTLPPYLEAIAEKESRAIAARDYVAGMSDHFAVSVYKSLFIPNPWAT